MKLKKINQIRIVLMLPLSLAFIVLGTITLSTVNSNRESAFPRSDNSGFLSTEVQDLLAQNAPEPPRPTAIPTTVPTSPPAPTTAPILSCNSAISFSGSGQNLTYRLAVNVTSPNISRTVLTINSQYLSNGTLGLVEFSGNCQQNNSGGFTCNRLGSSAQIFFKVENDSYRGPVNFQIKTVIDSGEAFERQEVNCDASFNVEGVNTPPSGMPIYLPGQPIPMNPFAPAENCEPLKDYCTPGSNLLDDGSFENPICTLNPDGVIPQISGKGCSAMNDQPTYYQADISSLIPIRSMAFFTEGGSDRFGRPEYVVQEVSGGQQCEEKLLSHGNNSLKIFSGGGYGLKGGLCLPIKSFGSQATAGINYRVSQQTPNVGQNVPVTFRIGYVNRPMNNNFYWRTQPELNESQITWVSSQTKTNSDYGSEEGAADRYTGGFLTGNVPAGSTGLCFMAESVGGVGINTFWDSAFVTTDGNACEDATNHSDGVDRSCGGWGCGGVEPTYSGNSYTDFDQEYYPFEMPPHWRARQCHFETITNGAPSPYGTLFVGLDMNSCDLNYRIESQRNLHPEWYKPDVACSSDRNWTYGYAWIGGIKDFGMLQYLDCAMGKLDDPEFKGTESNPFYCDQILNSFSNTRNRALLYEDPAFTLRYTNTYSGLVNAVQGESRSNFWKVPLLGSAVSSGVINNRQIEELRIDPFLIGKRNSGSGLNNYMKFNLEDFVISLMIRTEEHLFEDSIIPKNEVMVESLLAKGPVCTNIQGDPISKIHYGPADMVSDRAVFGFADDEGSFEHIIHAENNEVTPEELCNYQFREDRVVGATCTFFQIGEGKNVTFTEDNINSSLLDMGFVSYRAVPTLPPPAPSGIPQPGIGNCNKANLCGQEFGCEDTMRQLYDACIGSREVNEIGGNPFIRQELPNGWDHLQVFGLNKTLEAIWHNEYIQYNQVIRHENVGIDINQVVSIYDQQQPKCSIMPDDRKPVYCDDDADPQAASVKDKAAQVCRRVSPYNCGCSSDNFLTCLLECKTDFVRPPDLATVGIAIEGEPQPTPVPDPNSVNYRITDTSIRAILNNSYPSFLEQFVRILEPKTYEGEGGFNYEEGQIYNYDPRYTGGFLLANTGSGATQCTTDTGAGTKTGVSQVRIENYFAYMGQVPRMNERIGFAATNNKDPNTYQGVIFDADDSDVSSLISRIVRGEGEQYLALPYCDLLTPAEQQTCHMDTDTSCDCIIRTCQEQFDSKVMLMKEYLPLICKKLAETPGNDYHQRSPAECYSTISEHWMKNIINPAKEICDATPKSNKNFNCDPMANYLISQGFDSPELHHAKCEYIENADDVNKYDQCFPIDYELTGLVNPLLGERNQQGGWMLNQCYGPTSEEQREGYPAFTPADLALVEQCRSLNPALGLFTNAYYASDFGNFHNGIDLDSSPANQNIPIYSAGTGRVILIKETDGSREGYGNQIIIDHDGVYTRYAHLDDFIKADGSILKEGDVVTRDTQIGHMGNTGNSTSTHLHFEVLRCLLYTKNCAIDPTQIIFRTRTLGNAEDTSIENNSTDNVAIDTTFVDPLDEYKTGNIYQSFLTRNKQLEKDLDNKQLENKSALQTKLAMESNSSVDIEKFDDHIYLSEKVVLAEEEISEKIDAQVKAATATLCVKDTSISGIVSREEWGATPSTWEPQCVPVTRFHIHHTVGGAGGPDYSAVVRNIWQQHSNSRGWGDIGYNYLIAPDGTIFEGRQGGEGAIGAHTAGNNPGSIGIAFIGTYTTHLPTETALNSFNRLINHKADLWGITLRWQETVFGHRDFADAPCCCMNRTECPGTNLYGYLGDQFPSGSNNPISKEADDCNERFNFCTDQSWRNAQCYTDYLSGIGDDPPTGGDTPLSGDICDYGYPGPGNYSNYECLMIATSNIANSLPGGPRIPWQVLWAILYSESWHKCSESHVMHNQTGLRDATLLGFSRSGDAIYSPVDKCTGNPNQLGLHLDSNLVNNTVKGVAQFVNSTFDSYSASSEWQYCVNLIGVERNEQSSERFWDKTTPDSSLNTHRYESPDFFGRARVGDSLCAAVLKISEDNRRAFGSYTSPERWTEGMVRKAAENYHGSCGNNGSYCNLVYDRYLFAMEYFKDFKCQSSTTTPTTIPSIQPL